MFVLCQLHNETENTMSTVINANSSSSNESFALKTQIPAHERAAVFQANYYAAIEAATTFQTHVAALSAVGCEVARVEWPQMDHSEAKRAFYWSILTELNVLPMMSLSQKRKTLATLSPHQTPAERREVFGSDDPIHEFPEPSADAIDAFVAGIAGQMEEWYHENLIEIYEAVRPRSATQKQYRTNDRNRWKLGNKFIQTYATDTLFSSWYLTQSAKTLIQSIETALSMLDGKGLSETRDRDQNDPFSSVCSLADGETRGSGAVFENEYIQIKLFLNGNLHAKILRKDLLAKWNQLVGDPRALPGADGQEIDDTNCQPVNPFLDANGKRDGKEDFFATPRDLADRMVQSLGVSYPRGGKIRILEPSAGDGALADAVRREDQRMSDVWSERGLVADIVCVEENPDRAAVLAAKQYRVVKTDFLQMSVPVDQMKFDKIIMNPPFSNYQECAHLWHAYQMLKPGGTLVAVISDAVNRRSDRMYAAFRSWLYDLNATKRKTEAKFDNTQVETLILEIQKPE